MNIELANQDEFERLSKFYELCGYKGGFKKDDTILVSKNNKKDEIVGVVRICNENGALVLRGMQVHPGYQSKGIGTLLLEECNKVISERECYVVPYSNLEELYSKIDFYTVFEKDIPYFITERVKKYRKMGIDVIVMKKSNKQVEATRKPRTSP